MTKEVKTHDRDLYCIKENDVILLCRKATVWEEFSFSGVNLFYSRSVPQVVFALTDTFTQKGNPIDLGIEPLLNRIKSIDGWGDFNESKDVDKKLMADNVQKDKNRYSQFEDFARELRGDFKKAFSDVNVSSLEKIDKRRNNKWLS